MLCQQTSPKRWFANVNMTSDWAVTDTMFNNNDHHTPRLNTRIWKGGIPWRSRPGHHQTSARHWEEVKSVEFLSSPHDKASVQVHEGSRRKEIAKNEQTQLMLQFIVRQLGNNTSRAQRRTTEVFASSLPTRCNVDHIATKTIHQTNILPVQLTLNKETKDLTTLSGW